MVDVGVVVEESMVLGGWNSVDTLIDVEHVIAIMPAEPKYQLRIYERSDFWVFCVLFGF
jgi:hypothetical protein